MIDHAIRELVDRHDLSRDAMHEVFGQMMDGSASEIQKSAFLIALRMKGETAEEIAGAVLAMRERVVRLDTRGARVVDTCGTGGDGKGSINVSTLAAIVAAGAGAVVAKHGNRAVSSSCGSADLLAALGVDLQLEPAQVEDVLERVGIAFLFAPKLHPAMSAVGGVRRELGVRTIFNILGPLTNPAFAQRQVIGVYSLHLVPVVAEVLRALGAEHAMVVHSRDGMDEISISDVTDVCELKDGELRMFVVAPEDLGLDRYSLEAVRGGDATVNAAIAQKLLAGGGADAVRDLVAANGGAALYVAGGAESLRDGVKLALESISTGAAGRKLQELVDVTRELAGAGR